MINFNFSGQFQNRGETFERPVVIKNIACKPPAKGPQLMEALLMSSYSTGNSFLPDHFESCNQFGIKMLFFRKAKANLMKAMSPNVFPCRGKEFGQERIFNSDDSPSVKQQ